MSNAGQFQKGQSGNPRGRPPKHRALTDLLRKTGAQRSASGDSYQKIAVQRIWAALATGRLVFGVEDALRVIDLDATQYTNLAKMVFGQIDGPPPTNLDLTSGGKPMNVLFQIGEGIAPDATETDAPGFDDGNDVTD